MNENERILQENIQRNLQAERKDYRKLNKEVNRLEKNDFLLGKPFNLVRTDQALWATGITALPPTVMGILSGAGATAAAIAACLFAMNQGFSLSGQEQQIMSSLENFMATASNFTARTFDIAAKTAVLPLSIGTVCCAKGLIEQAKTTKREDLIERMETIKEIMQMLNDIKYGKADPSLDFAKDFLSSVDLKENSNYYNLILLNRLANHREVVKAELNGAIEQGTSKGALQEFAEILKEESVDWGASKRFVNNFYIKDLVSMYAKETENKKK